jgi:lipid A 3-O-deacylase
VSLGIVGESALGRQIQNGWHKIIGVDEVRGWDNQLFDEPGIIVAYEQRHRFILDGASGGWGTDLIPHAGVSLGNVATYINAGAQVRLGWRLPSDFGHALIRPGGDSNTHASADLVGWAFHGFAGFDARLSAWNIFLDGNTWKDSHKVDKREASLDLFGGLSLRFGRFQCDYTQVYRSKEFYGQDKRDVFGSLSLSIRL